MIRSMICPDRWHFFRIWNRLHRKGYLQQTGHFLVLIRCVNAVIIDSRLCFSKPDHRIDLCQIKGFGIRLYDLLRNARSLRIVYSNPDLQDLIVGFDFLKIYSLL